MLIPGQQHNRLARKLMLAVILSSTLITIITTAYQLYGLYSRDMSAIDTRLEEIETVLLDSIAQDLWTADYAELNVRVESMMNIPDILFIEVRENGKSVVRFGENRSEKVIQRNFKLSYFYRNESRKIGDLIVQFNLQKVYERVISQLTDIVISNTIKTFFIGFIILLIFNRLVTRHIKELSDHAAKMTPERLQEKFKYSDKHASHNIEDELDVLSNAVNVMQESMYDSLKEVERSRSEIHERERFYQSILDMNSAVIYVKDKEGRLIYANRECERLFVSDKENILNKTTYDFFDAETASMLARNDKAVLQSQVPFEVLEEFERASNTTRKKTTYLSLRFPLYDENKKIYGIGCVSTNVQALKSAQRELETKKQELEEIFNSLIDGVITVDESFNIIEINYAAERILGYYSRELVGRDISILMRDDDKPKYLMIKHTLVRLLEERNLGTSREYYACRKNGEEFPIQLSINKLPNDASGKKRFIASFIDLSEMKETERLLRQSMKLEALGKLTGGIAHDYNNMLGVISGYSELLKVTAEQNESSQNYINQIIHACERGTNLTRKLLSFSSGQSSDVEDIDMLKVLFDMKDMLEKTLTVKIQLKLVVTENIWNIRVDKNALEDAILNISINAMHAMPNGGKLNIDVSNVLLDDVEAKIFKMNQGEYVRISIIDSGYGMTEEIQNKIFDPFFTTKGEKGTGLGLSQVYGFVTKSGGSIHVKSAPGMGTRFVMYFPHAEKFSDVLSEDSAVSHNDSYTGSENILVVEDEEALRILTAELLSDCGYKVYTAANGLEAIPLLEKYQFALVLSDLLMPEMDGYRLTEYIRNKYPQTRIQLLSGYHDEETGFMLDEDLKQNIINKPVSNSVLLKKIRQILDS